MRSFSTSASGSSSPMAWERSAGSYRMESGAPTAHMGSCALGMISVTVVSKKVPSSASASTTKRNSGLSLTHRPICFAERIKPKVFTVRASLQRCSFFLFRLSDLAGSTNPSRIHSAMTTADMITVPRVGFSNTQLKNLDQYVFHETPVPFSVSNGCRIPLN